MAINSSEVFISKPHLVSFFCGVDLGNGTINQNISDPLISFKPHSFIHSLTIPHIFFKCLLCDQQCARRILLGLLQSLCLQFVCCQVEEKDKGRNSDQSEGQVHCEHKGGILNQDLGYQRRFPQQSDNMKYELTKFKEENMEKNSRQRK